MPYAPSGSNRNKDRREEKKKMKVMMISTDLKFACYFIGATLLSP
jgi:hypothetical protein